MIPQSLTAAHRWTTWSYVEGRKKPMCRVNDESTFLTYKRAYALAKLKGHKLGFVLGDGWCGLDLDNCISEEGVVDPRAVAVLSSIGGYWEKSPSGHGLKVIGRGEISGEVNFAAEGGSHRFNGARYFAIDGSGSGNVEDEIDLSFLGCAGPQSRPLLDRGRDGRGKGHLCFLGCKLCARAKAYASRVHIPNEGQGSERAVFGLARNLMKVFPTIGGVEQVWSIVFHDARRAKKLNGEPFDAEWVLDVIQRAFEFD